MKNLKLYFFFAAIVAFFGCNQSQPTASNNDKSLLYSGILDTVKVVANTEIDTSYHFGPCGGRPTTIATGPWKESCVDTLADSFWSAPETLVVDTFKIPVTWNIPVKRDSACDATALVKLAGNSSWASPTLTTQLSGESAVLSISASAPPFKVGDSTHSATGAQYKIAVLCGD